VTAASNTNRKAQSLKQIIADNLTRARSVAKLSQGRLGEKSGLGRMTVQRIESGRGNVTVNNLEKVCNALSIPPAQLLTQGGAAASLPQGAQNDVRFGDAVPATEDQLAIELPAGQAFEVARWAATVFRRTITLINPINRSISGFAMGNSKESDAD
jgi:transcriptional regulator with XRE-family HTH domain